MATQTTNLGLTKPDGSEKVNIATINTNMDTIDTYAGTNNASIINLAEDIGVVVNGNKTKSGVTAAVGQYVILKNSTISNRTDGLYTAAKAIPANTAIDASYLTAVSGGGLNALNTNIATENLGSLANQSALETALTTLGGSMSDMQFKNIRFNFSAVPSSGIFNGKSGYYIGAIKRAYNNVYAVDVQNSGTGSQKGEHITGTYNGTSWTWMDLNNKFGGISWLKVSVTATEKTLTIGNGTRAVMFVGDSTENQNGEYMLFSNSSGGVALRTIVAANNLNINTSTANKLKLTASSGTRTIVFQISEGSIVE